LVGADAELSVPVTSPALEGAARKESTVTVSVRCDLDGTRDAANRDRGIAGNAGPDDPPVPALLAARSGCAAAPRIQLSDQSNRPAFTHPRQFGQRSQQSVTVLLRCGRG
jgi:hypothetical protein